MLNFNSKADVLDIVESYEFVIKILDNVSDLRKNLRLLKNAKSELFASFANDCKVEFLESALNHKSLNNKLISSKECKGLSLLLQYSNKSVNTSLVYRFTQNKKTQMITLCKVDSNIDLDSAIAKVKEMQSVLNSKDFKDSYLSLKDYLTMKKNQNDLHILEAFEKYLKSDNFREATIKGYRNMFKLHILPYFENVKCSNVTEAFVRMWLDKITKKIKFSKKVFILNRSIFEYLKEKRYINRNVFNDINFKKTYKKANVKYKKLSALSENELITILNKRINSKLYNKLNMQDTLIYKILQFMILIPLRVRNVALMEWKNIDFEKKLLRFSGAEMKTKKDFTLPLNDLAFKILQDLHKQKISKYVFDRNLSHNRLYRYNTIVAIQKCKKLLDFKSDNESVRKIVFKVAKQFNLNEKCLYKTYFCCERGKKLVNSIDSKIKHSTKKNQEIFCNVIAVQFRKIFNLHPHSLRKTFLTLLSEKRLKNHNFAIEDLRLCLGHNATNGSGLAYLESNLISLKKQIMDFWNDYIKRFIVVSDNKLQMVASDSFKLDFVASRLDSTNLKELLESAESAESNDNDSLSF